MKKFYLFALCIITCAGLSAQANSNPYGILYTILNTKCQNSSCHSATSTGDNLKFDQDSASVYNQIFAVASTLWPSSVTEHNLLINPEMPYQSFLLRKIAGAGFDTDLSIDSAGEGNLMVDTGGNQLANYEIEYFRQWIRYGALPVYSNSQPHPDFPTYYQYYMDTNYLHGVVQNQFLPKPAKPDSGKTYFQFRMGPHFLPVTGAVEQEVTEQQLVYFPYLPQITELDGHMNDQSHHLLLFQYTDSLAARDPNYTTGLLGNAPDISDMGQVTPPTASFTEPFSGSKNLVAAYQTPDNNVAFPKNTAMFWDQKTYLDFDYHTKNYNADAVLPCDFYVTIYYEPRNPNTIQMVSNLQNNDDLGDQLTGIECGTPPLLVNVGALPLNQNYVENYSDNSNSGSEQLRYLFMTAGHTHKFGTSFYIIRKDTTGALADTIYDGGYDYANQVETGTWDWQHPPIEYWNNPNAPHEGLEPVTFGVNGSGLVANTGWYADSSCVRFGFTTMDEMQLFYYMYTLTDPDKVSAINTPTQPDIYFEIMPNPTNGSDGKLVYNLDKDSKVEASIIDVTGKTIADLGQENEVMGLHTVSLSGGKTLSSGIYFARLIINGNFYTKKFIVTE